MQEWSRDKNESRSCGTSKQKIGNRLDYENYLYFLNDGSSDEFYAERTKDLLAIIRRVMITELTERQRQCVQLVKVEKIKIKEAASILGLTSSTVSRHLKGAQRKFDRALKHYEVFQRLRAKE